MNSKVIAKVAHKVLTGVHLVTGHAMNRVGYWRTNWHLGRLRRKVWTQKPGSLARCFHYTMRINNGPNFYILYKDIFIQRIYHFEAQRPDPFILDCGSNIGMSILYFKHVYPQARIVGLEPDPVIFPYLQENVTVNNLTDVRLVQAALAGQEGVLTFYSDGKHASHLADPVRREFREGWTNYDVPCVRLRDYLVEPVDFLKMNIEGTEWEVLADSEKQLRQVREMVIEYHHLPGLSRTLDRILEMLSRSGFEYLINSFDSETNRGVCPPFHLTPESRYYLLIYAKRMD